MTGLEHEQRARFAADPHRPRYHLAPPTGWMNDPNGLIDWRGHYHAFYQWNPDAALWGNIHWGHAISHDLIHWEDLPVALAPTPDGPDADGCWSGCAVDDRGTATVIYTGYSKQRGESTCVATSPDDMLITWQKDPANPVIAGPPAGLATLGFRDHSVWRQGDEWRMVIGSGLRGQGGAALLFASPDLRHWRYLHPLCVGDPAATGTMWECPDFFPLGDRHVLLISPMPQQMSYALIGTYDGAHFTPEILQPLDAHLAFYAPQTFRDADGRRVIIGWLKEQRPDAALVAAGWAGMLALPRMLSLGPDGRLRQTPLPGIHALFGSPTLLTPRLLTTEPTVLCQGNHLALRLSMDPGQAPLDLLLGDGTPLALLRYQPATDQIAIAPDAASLAEAPQVVLHRPATAPLTLQIFLDGSSIEVFANERVCLTWRYYPRHADQVRLAVAAPGATLREGTWQPLAT